jgi:hypothetical protein
MEKTELPFTNTKVFGKQLRFILEDCRLSIHEVAHNSQFVEEAWSTWDWNDWSRIFNRKLELQYVDSSRQVPSWEDVAWDITKILNFDLHDWYINVLDGKKNSDYMIGNSAYILLQAGLMDTERNEKIRSAILDKYVSKIII